MATNSIYDRMQTHGHIFANYNTCTVSLHDSAFFEVSIAKCFQGRDPKLLNNKIDETTPAIRLESIMLA